MICLMNAAVYYASRNIFQEILSTVIGIVIFVIVCAYCYNLGSADSGSSGTDNHRSGSYRQSDYSSDDDFEQTNYDPTWDDAYFEKTGIEPWFDDNPWDHEKK